jgi:hypothetical protein
VLSFRAQIQIAGVNPYVEVPAEVSAALAEYARARRIRVEGRLNGVEFQATLVPVRDGGHRLYVPGGLRTAAGVGVGEIVDFQVEGRVPDDVRPPEDLAAALAARPPSAEMFAGLPPSHRRELIRWLEDARTEATRQRRMDQIVDRELGRDVSNPGARAGRPLWSCPKCGRSFVSRSIYHACGQWTLDDSFAGRPPQIRELFEAVHAVISGFGPVTLVPYRDRVAFMERVRFAGVVPRNRWLEVKFWLPRRIESPRLGKVESLSPYTHIHALRIAALDEIDDELTGWLREAYAVGRQEHLKGTSAGSS